MLTLVHGDNTGVSRKELHRMRSEAQGKEIREISGKSFDPAAFAQATESSSLFGGEVLVIVEGLLAGLNKKTKSSQHILRAVTSAAKQADIILYEEKEIDKATVAKLGMDTKVWLFKTPVVLFRFLDGLAPGCAKRMIPLLATVLGTEPAEVVYVLVVRRVRQLIQIADGVTPAGLQSWQASRLTAQARLFTIDELIVMHNALIEMDIAVKSGATPFSLAQLLQQFIIEEFG